MANRFQQQSVRRKVIYFALIIALFSACWVVRTQASWGVEKQAEDLELREQSLGEVDLTDKALRLTLTGSRGFAVCGLWWTAIEKQKKHEWNELELLVRSLIKLQPHFVTPWLFQSWNLAYTVSVECDRVKDKYFYIARGVNLLADGERQNKDNPDMRLYVGIYQQNKMGISDEQNTLRSLYQMSCIEPAERDPARFRRTVGERTEIDWDAFEDFCRRHPFLVRRLHDKLRCKTPDDVIEFLAANQKLPSRYEDRPANAPEGEQSVTRYASVAERFPCLPPRQKFNPGELTYDSDLGDDFDNYHAARAWYGYSQDPLVGGLRRPRFMSQIIFENYPARAQSYVAERLGMEGWFDNEGWEIKDWFPKDKAHPEVGKRSIRVGRERNWSAEAWDKGFQMYKDFGEGHGLYRSAEDIQSLSDEDQKTFNFNRMVTNFQHHLTKAYVERGKEAIAAHKCFFKADELRQAGDRELAMEMYERPEGFPTWKKLLIEASAFRDDEDVQEDTYLMQRRYLAMIRDKRMPTIRRILLTTDLMTQAAISPPAAKMWLSLYLIPSVTPPLIGPFDALDDEGKPLIGERAINTVCERYHLARDPRQTLPAVPQDMPRINRPHGRSQIIRPGGG
jgi:hypothetical protein